MSKKPNIRFKEFSDDWEQRKAKELCSISTGKSNTQDRVDDGKYPFYVRSPIVEHSNRYLFDEEAVLTVGDGVGTGKVFHYVNGKYDLHQRVYRMFDFSKEITGRYFYYYFSNHFYNRVMAMTAKTSVDSVRYEMIADMDIAIPTVQEQQAISAIFENLDHLITLHQRKCDKLKELKKHMLKKMFPKNNEKFPEYRFDGFTDPWEQRKLGEYVSITSGEAPSKFEEGTELYVKVDDLNYNDKYVVDTQNKVAEHSTVKKVTKGSVVFPKRGAAIMTNKVRIMGIDSYMDTNMMALTSEKLDSEFLYNIISKEGLYRIADTSTIPQINNKHVEPYEVTIPSLDEQRRIGTFFKQLDHLITLHQRKVDNLKIFKKFMLKKMFV